MYHRTHQNEEAREIRCGPAYYLKKTALPWLGPIFMAVGIGTYGFTGPTIQAFNIAESAHNAFGLDKTVMGILMAVFFGIVVLGGMRRIGSFAEYVVPFMAGVFMLLTIIILILNHARIPGMIVLIVKSALNMEAAYGGIFGSAVSWGIRRAIYSSEAGMGSGAHAAASSEVPHPIKQGVAQASSVYYTLIICTCTALMILCTGMYNVSDGMGGHIVQGAHGVAEGIGYTQAAIDTLSPGTPIGSIFIAVAIFFFAFTTLLSFGFYAAVNIAYLMGNSKYLRTVVVIVGLAQMFSIYLGSTNSSALAWGIADVGVALGAWVNLIGMIFLGGVCAKCMRDYDNQMKQGLTPVFRPRELGIEGADLWDDIVEKHYKNINDKPASGQEN